MVISASEQVILEVLWRDHPLTVGQIIERVQETSDWHPNTIKTMLSRLVTKGTLERSKDGKRYFYSPAISRDEVVDEETNGLLSRFFNGKMAPLLAHFAQHKKISTQELKEIEEVLDKLKKKND
ncbi:BlaI/MecI/CopY family transcriptional regulator [Microbulbifer sp. JMSA003]|uniref:BlaI/MecI/CopY family transcriptional regulator n=1 Tax=Microbulbifer sp. JMSA003 TaxID=3243369 RepID=UPI00403A269F